MIRSLRSRIVCVTASMSALSSDIVMSGFFPLSWRKTWLRTEMRRASLFCAAFFSASALPIFMGQMERARRGMTVSLPAPPSPGPPSADLPAALRAELRPDGDVVAVHALRGRDHAVPALRAELHALRDERLALRAVRALFRARPAGPAELHRHGV